MYQRYIKSLPSYAIIITTSNGTDRSAHNTFKYKYGFGKMSMLLWPTHCAVQLTSIQRSTVLLGIGVDRDEHNDIQWLLQPAPMQWRSSHPHFVPVSHSPFSLPLSLICVFGVYSKFSMENCCNLKFKCVKCVNVPHAEQPGRLMAVDGGGNGGGSVANVCQCFER